MYLDGFISVFREVVFGNAQRFLSTKINFSTFYSQCKCLIIETIPSTSCSTSPNRYNTTKDDIQTMKEKKQTHV